MNSIHNEFKLKPLCAAIMTASIALTPALAQAVDVNVTTSSGSDGTYGASGNPGADGGNGDQGVAAAADAGAAAGAVPSPSTPAWRWPLCTRKIRVGANSPK